MIPPAPPAAAARRMISTNSRISSSVGPNPKRRLVRNEGPFCPGCALIVTPLLWSRLESCELSANEGTWVENRVVGWALELLAGYLTAWRKVPWMESPVEEMSLTLPLCTWLRKVGL